MAELQITLTAPERDCLVELLEKVLKETRIEEHRTRAPAYRERILEHEALMARVLDKLRPPTET